MRCGGKAFPSGSKGGFTLLELLIATAVGAIVLLVINATFFSALRLHDSTHASIDQDLEIQRALGIVRRDFAGLMLPGVLAGQLQTEAFSSNTLDSTGGERVTPDIFTNSGRVDGWSGYSEVQSVSYYLTPAQDGTELKNLVRVVTRNLLAVQPPDTENQTLLPRVVSAAISFYDGSEWTDTWDSETTTTLPTAIRFSLVLAPRGDDAPNLFRPPVELIVPVVVSTPAQQQAATAVATL